MTGKFLRDWLNGLPEEILDTDIYVGNGYNRKPINYSPSICGVHWNGDIPIAIQIIGEVIDDNRFTINYEY